MNLQLKVQIDLPLSKDKQDQLWDQTRDYSLIPKSLSRLNFGKLHNPFLLLVSLMHSKYLESSKSLVLKDIREKTNKLFTLVKREKPTYISLTFTFAEFQALYGSRTSRQTTLLKSLLNILKITSFEVDVSEAGSRYLSIAINLIPSYVVDHKKKTVTLEVHPLFFALLPYDAVRFKKNLYFQFLKYLTNQRKLLRIPDSFLALICSLEDKKVLDHPKSFALDLTSFHDGKGRSARKLPLLRFLVEYLFYTYRDTFTLYYSDDGKEYKVMPDLLDDVQLLFTRYLLVKFNGDPSFGPKKGLKG